MPELRAGDTGDSPESRKRKREIARMLLESGAIARPVVPGRAPLDTGGNTPIVPQADVAQDGAAPSAGQRQVAAAIRQRQRRGPPVPLARPRGPGAPRFTLAPQPPLPPKGPPLLAPQRAPRGNAVQRFVRDELLDTGARRRAALDRARTRQQAAESQRPADDQLQTDAFPLVQIPAGAELVVDPSRQIGLKERALFGLTSNAQERRNVIAQRVFPDKPLAEAAQRIGVTEDGTVVAVADDGRLLRVMPQGTFDRIAGGLAEGLGPAIPAGLGAVAGTLTLPAAATGIGATVPLGAALAAGVAGEKVRQDLGDRILGDAAVGDDDLRQVALEGLKAGTGQFGGGAASGFLAQQAPKASLAAREFIAATVGQLTSDLAGDLAERDQADGDEDRDAAAGRMPPGTARQRMRRRNR